MNTFIDYHSILDSLQLDPRYYEPSEIHVVTIKMSLGQLRKHGAEMG